MEKKHLTKIQHAFMAKPPNKLNTERTLLRMSVRNPNKTLSPNTFSCNNRNGKRVSTEATPIQPRVGKSQPEQSREEKKRSKKEKCLCLQIT